MAWSSVTANCIGGKEDFLKMNFHYNIHIDWPHGLNRQELYKIQPIHLLNVE